MSALSIDERVVCIVHEVLLTEIAKIMPASRIKEDLGADSLDQVSLIMALEDEFDGSISDEEAKTLVSVSDIVAFIKRQAKQSPELSYA